MIITKKLLIIALLLLSIIFRVKYAYAEAILSKETLKQSLKQSLSGLTLDERFKYLIEQQKIIQNENDSLQKENDFFTNIIREKRAKNSPIPEHIFDDKNKVLNKITNLLSESMVIFHEIEIVRSLLEKRVIAKEYVTGEYEEKQIKALKYWNKFQSEKMTQAFSYLELYQAAFVCKTQEDVLKKVI
ncbi:hypothetical protein [Bartonella rochalimae]|uniref:Uncharacterized protein n=1 Tax=Bartonella rochalimae ATCC BAA-1498 TaxID=685782 RepID=E6YLS9_9HYPH|nr:hypothetical protein [Bartonella rochalimae]KEC56821.1 hypothetical protein O99_00243 [Bartonella rochalimae ATCC BAA-1498]CBI77831.1 exported hypothetical protein [Bartonella rochalimae ATCC BAA-1498]